MNEIATIDPTAKTQTAALAPAATTTTPAAAPTIEMPKKAKKAKIKKSALPKKATYFILYVPDMAKAVAFYKGTLGLKLGFESPEWTEFKCGIKFALHAWSPETAACASQKSDASACTSFKPQKTSLTFGVKDAGRSYEAFKTLGVKVLGEPHQVCEDGRAFAFEDPFGNQLSIYGR
jgi:predicted enzyme related to lactoylglutathione lyase